MVSEKRAFYCTFGNQLELTRAYRVATKLDAVTPSIQRYSFVSYPHHACFVFDFSGRNAAELSDLEKKVSDAFVTNGIKIIGETKYRGQNTLRRIDQWIMAKCTYGELKGAH